MKNFSKYVVIKNNKDQTVFLIDEAIEILRKRVIYTYILQDKFSLNFMFKHF